MVHPQEDKNNALHQFRPVKEERLVEPPYGGEVIGGRRKPPFEVTGLDALSPILGSVRFPATKEDVIAAIGEAVIPIDKRRTMRVGELVERASPNDFRSSMEFERAIQSVLGDRDNLGRREPIH